MSEVLEIAAQAVRLYAESHPRPSFVNYTQAGEMLEKSRQTVARMVRQGHIKVNGIGLIPISEIDRILATRPASSRYLKHGH